jgi:hypothetical protein
LKQTKAILSELRYAKEVLWPDIWFGCKNLAVTLGKKLQSEEQLLESFLT